MNKAMNEAMQELAKVLKFRAFHKPKKKMYDVHGLEWSVDSLVFRERRKALLGEDQVCRWHAMYLIDKDGVTEVARGHEVIANEYELMQFIGRRDKKGKEIYAGDIVSTDNEQQEDWPVEEHYKGVVTYDSEKCCYYIKQAHDQYTPLIGNHAIVTIEVIGNIYEHPNLLPN